MKKYLAVTLVTLMVPVYSGTMRCEANNVTVPCQATKWDFGFRALYLRPSYNSDYAYAFLESLFQYRPPTYYEVKPDRDFAFQLEGSYHFNTGNDLTVNWIHFDDTTHFNTYNLLTSEPALGNPIVANKPVLKNELDQANAVLGQYVDVSERKKFRFFAGLQAVKIENNITLIQQVVGYPASVYTTRKQSKFSGVGPTAGIGFANQLFNNFQLTSLGQASILLGNCETKASINDPRPLQLVEVTQLKASKDTVVPALEIKVGGSYMFSFINGMMSIDAGYQWMTYFKAVPGLVTNYPLVGSGLQGPKRYTVSNQSYDGVYAGFHWVSGIV
ncbi:Lpg1974 family pore-forming outer membrane protein [Legionella sp. W05-934-2]|jgi:hypothetical protein|uniref:Lpg1974 family pore-forming outer membrane protein n=1 Tax=Legionella sp. W05-934-2 TaxID=1198649 RepID=UPI003461DC94